MYGGPGPVGPTGGNIQEGKWVFMFTCSHIAKKNLEHMVFVLVNYFKISLENRR